MADSTISAAPDIAQEKTCTKCGETKSLSGFYKSKSGKLGLASVCKDCSKAYALQWQANNTQRKADADLAYRSANREAYKERAKAWRLENPERKRAQDASRPPEDPEKLRLRTSLWAQNNPEKALAIRRRKDAKRMSTAKGRLTNSISCGIRASIRRGAKAGRRSFDLVGYTLQELNDHLEALFRPGMSWENYGKNGWEIDHIIPVSSFSYETPDCPDFKSAWALSNLQPLWGPENWAKGARIIHSESEKYAQPRPTQRHSSGPALCPKSGRDR